jgi:ammonium transporter
LRLVISFLTLLAFLAGPALAPVRAQETEKTEKKEETKDPVAEAAKNASDALVRGDTAWMLASTALVMLMVPGLALFYAGMVRRKNVLATLMQSMIALAVIGVFWVAVGYSLAFGAPLIKIGNAGIIGWKTDLVFLAGISDPGQLLPNSNIPIYVHMLFQGMFAIITPALISGAFAERIRFGPYVVFLLLWSALVYCPLAHMVWAMNWWDATEAGTKAVGLLGALPENGGFGAIDFAGGTVVHIAAGFSALGGILVLRKRVGYPEQAMHPNSMVLCVVGAGILWFGWFGFNGGSGLLSGGLAGSAFAATQAAAAAAALSWVLAEWLYKGKPTALGFASGVVAGLVAVTPASGYVYVWGGLAIGAVAGVVCYIAVCLKPGLNYDDSLDVFGVHGVGGFLGAVLTGVFCYKAVNSAAEDGLIAGGPQLVPQIKAAAVSAALAFVGGLVLTKLVDLVLGFATTPEAEIEGLDRTEHGETGFDFGMETASVASLAEPRAASVPPAKGKRFAVVVDGAPPADLVHTWSEMCRPDAKTTPEFKALYPYVTTVQGNRFTFRGGDQELLREQLERLLESRLNKDVKTRVESN